LCEASGAIDDIRASAVRAVLVEHGIEVPNCGDDLDIVAEACAAARRDHELAWRRNEQFVVAHATRSMLSVLDGVLPPEPALRRRVGGAYATASDDAVFDLVPGVADTLRLISAAGVSIGIVCDVGLAPSSVLVANLERHGVLDCFAHWSFSDMVGVYKPDPRIFEHALRGLGVHDPSAAWHVGDLRRTDVAGARASGMGTVRVAVVYDDSIDEGPEADAVVTHYAQLPDVLGLG
jgi:FMN phosphatase YigB (HAD superfamily)